MSKNKKPGMYVVFDKLPGHDGCTFVEVEDEHGKSLGAEECRTLAWLERPDGLVELGPFASMANTESLDRLALYILNQVPGEPAYTQSFVDCTIRILEEQLYPLQQGLVMSYLAANAEVTSTQLAQFTGRAASWAFQLLEKMRKDNFLESVEGSPSTYKRRS